MSRNLRILSALAAVLLLTVGLSFAQSSGEAIYKTKCLMCHGNNGMAETPVGKAMKIKPVSDPEVKKMTLEQMITAVKKGSGKMTPFEGKLSDAEIKEAVQHFRSMAK